MRLLIGQVLLLCVASVTMVTATGSCIKTFTATDTKFPDDELMNAFYIADPDPRTGYSVFDEDPKRRHLNGMTAKLVSSKLSYNDWLYKRHSGEDHFQNLWSYITRMVVSEVSDVFGHFNSLQSQGVEKPRAAIDFNKIITTFETICKSKDTSKKDWPIRCYPAKYFCSFDAALKKMKQLLYFTSPNDVEHMTCQVNKPKPAYHLTGMSQVAIDNTERSEMLKLLFDDHIVRTFDERVLLRPLYRSGLVRNSMYVLLSDEESYVEWLRTQLQGFEKKMVDKCKETSSIPLGKFYYCRARDILQKTRECYTEKKGVCFYSSLFQPYFEMGRFIYNTELLCVKSLQKKLSETTASLISSLQRKDAGALIKHVSLYEPLLKVSDKHCTYDWKKAFDCGEDKNCKMWSLYPPYCLIYFPTKILSNFLKSKGSASWDDINVTKISSLVKISFSFPPYVYNSKFDKTELDVAITSLHKQVDILRNKFNIPGFKEITRYIPTGSFIPESMKRDMCDTVTIETRFKPYCLVGPLVSAIWKFTDSVSNSLNKKTRILHLSTDYRLRLEQLQASRAFSYLNKQAQTYFQILSNKLAEIPAYLEQNFKAIGNYFGSLAKFDSDKAMADVAFIKSTLNKYKNRLGPKIKSISDKMSSLFGFAFLTTELDVLGRVGQLVLEIAANCNPLKHIFGDSDPAAIVDRVNDLAVSVSKFAKVIALGVNDLPELGRRATKLQVGLSKNSGYIKNVRKLIENLNSNDADIEATVKTFLSQYNDYSPEVTADMISSLGEYWGVVIENLCEAAYDVGTSAAALLTIGLTAKGDCVKLKPLVAEVTTISEEIYNYQFEMMETLAKACRAKYAASLSNGMKITYSTKVKVDMAFFKNNAIISFLISTLHIWTAVSEYCDNLTYMKSGVTPSVCKDAMQLPNEYNIGKVISYKQQPSCNTGSRSKAILDIPLTISKQSNDLAKLLNGDELVFKIPDSAWLLKQGLISREDRDNAFYVEQFQVFLPVDIKDPTLVQVIATPSSANILRKGELKYLFYGRQYSTRYTVNKPLVRCPGTVQRLPYDFCKSLTQVCILKTGAQVRDIQPSIYNTWKIRMSDPEMITVPKVTTKMILTARITYCSQAKTSGRRRKRNELSREKRQSGSSYCCKNNKYWNGKSCEECPSGSTRRFSGYYCE